MEDKKVVISVEDLRYKIKETVENCRNEINNILDEAEEYIRVAHVIEEEEETPKSKFNVGDILTCRDDRYYYITSNKSVLMVTEVRGKFEIKVKVLDHKDKPDEVGEEYYVNPSNFKLIKDIL